MGTIRRVIGTVAGVLLLIFVGGVGALLLFLWLVGEEVDTQQFQEDGKFRLGGEYLVGGASFDSVQQCPLEFPEFQTIIRCFGEDLGFQEKRWWVWAEGVRRGHSVTGSRADCSQFGFSSENLCWLNAIANEREYQRQRLYVQQKSVGRAIVVESMNMDLRRVVLLARDR